MTQVLCRHNYPYGCCAVCMTDDEAVIRKWEQEFRRFDESNEQGEREEA